MTPKPFPKAPQSNAKILEKLSTSMTGVLHMDFLKMEKDYSIALFHENEFFLTRVVKGAKILP